MTKFLKIFSSLLTFLVFAHCSGQSLLNDPDLNINANGSLEVTALHHLEDGSALPPEANGHKIITNDLGFVLDLEEALINWHELRLISQGDDPNCVAGLDQNILLDAVENLLGADLTATLLAMATIPLASYCQYEVTIAPTPVSALKFHEGEAHPGGGSTGIDVSYHMKGTWSKGVDAGTFEIVGTDAITIAGIFQAEEGGQKIDHPLHFHGEETQAHLTFGSEYDLLFHGIDFLTQNADQQKAALIQNLAGSIHQAHGDH